MNAGLRALLAGIVDYAGLFPPAKLPLDPAIRNYARYRNEPEAWMLGRFVVPVGQLDALAPFVQELFADGPPLALTVLAATPEDRRAAEAFAGRMEGRVVADSFEVKAPSAAEVSRGWASGAVTTVWLEIGRRGADRYTAAGWASDGATVWCETGLEGDWRKAVGDTVAVLRGAPATGYKLRCGGATAAAVPTAEQVAFVLSACREAGVPLKCTAGLHHPFPQFDPAVGATTHGFVNVFAAGVLAHAGRADAARLEAVLGDADSSHFVFTDDGLRWDGLAATAGEIAAARRGLAASFGSCSFDEPRDDLRALGWL
jgi:hypothetical protein